MRRLASFLALALAAGALAACSPDVPTLRFECTCRATAVATDNSRLYPLCEAPDVSATADAVDLCAKDFGATAGCECTCTRHGDC